MKKKIYLINILLVILVFLIVLIITNTSPFGNNLFSISDGIFQFKPMLYDHIMKIKLHILESYSFNNGLGNPVIFNMLYYLASPINYVALLFKHPDSMYLSVILVKMAIASISMTFFTSKKTDRVEVIIIATLSYVFCSWFVTYYYYLTWIDAFMVFPLFVYGLEEIINKRISYIYIFSLAYMIMTSFYLTFSIAIFTIIYFVIYEFFYHKNNIKEKIKSFSRISLGTILSLLLSFVVIYSLVLFSIKSGIKLEKYSSLYHTNIMDYIKSFAYGSISFITSQYESKTYPNIACNSLIFINSIYFFLNKNIKRKDKFYAIIAIFIFSFAVLNSYFDFVLNFFHQIRGLTYRYAFIFSFFMIYLYIENNKNKIEETKEDLIRKLLTYLIIAIYIAIIIPFMIDDYSYMGDAFVYCIFTICFLVTTFIHGNNIFDTFLKILIICLQTCFLIYRVSFVEVPTEIDTTKQYSIINTKYRLPSEENQQLIKKLELSQNSYTFNMNLYTNQKSSNILTSMTYSNIIYMLRDLGNTYYSNTSAYINNKNDISEMLFNIKDKYYLEKIYAVNKNIKNTKLKYIDKTYNEQLIIKNMTNIEIYDEINYKGTIKDGKCILYKKDIIKNDEESYFNNNIIKNDIVIDKKECNKYHKIYHYKKDKLEEAYDYLSKNQIKYTNYSDTKLEGTINVDENQIIFTSIPYDTNWDIYIDSKKVKPIKLLDSLIGIEVKKGNHKIKMEYKEHLLIPTLISLATFIIIMINLLVDKIGKKREYE